MDPYKSYCISKSKGGRTVDEYFFIYEDTDKLEWMDGDGYPSPKRDSWADWVFQDDELAELCMDFDKEILYLDLVELTKDLDVDEVIDVGNDFKIRRVE